MKIEFTRTARWQLRILNEIQFPTSGFVLGSSLGRIRIFDNLFPLIFNKTNINRIYHRVFMETGEQLQGVFFANREIFYHDWFLENYILELSDNGNRIYFYHLDPKDGQKRCEPVLEL